MLGSNSQDAAFIPLHVYGNAQQVTKVFFWFVALILIAQVAGIGIVLTNKDTVFAIIIAISIPPVLASFILLRRGQLEWSAILLALIMQSLLTAVSTAGLGIHNISNLGIPAILIIASIVVTRRTMALLTLFALGCVCWLVLGELSGAFTPKPLERSVPGDLLSASLVIIMTALMARVLAEALFRNNMQLQKELIDRRRAEEALRKSEARLRAVVEHSHDGILFTDAGGTILYRSPSYYEINGYTVEERLGHDGFEMVHPDDLDALRRDWDEMVRNPNMLMRAEYRIRHKNGTWRWIATSAKNLLESAEIQAIVVTSRDITVRKQAEDAVAESEKRYRGLFENASVGIFHSLPGGTFLRVNPSLAAMLGYESPQEMVSRITDINTQVYVDSKRRPELFKAAMERDDWVHAENRYRRKDGSVITANLSVRKVLRADGTLAYLEGFVEDITERKHEEETRAKLESQLAHAQRMESIGRLAGGVAHDFNNLLQVILGHVEIAMNDLDPGIHLYDNLQQIYEAAKRSADLTRQLLAFARKQDVVPRVLDLNELVLGMIKMLQRLIGEDIRLAWEPWPILWPVRMDPSQLDQILANLAVNARDAIEGVGKLTVSTENVIVDEALCLGHTDWMPGEYVLLTVIDTGEGMSRDILEHVFEPFFTTKGLGKGTGLGLATVYGIVKQNNGLIEVSSEPGNGTIFKIYLPRAQDVVETKPATDEQESAFGSETVLVVEDEDGILALARMVLDRLGYTVLTARSPHVALSLMAQYEGPVHLLLTDVVMPEMSGRELRTRVAASRPGIKTLFMSGYTADVIAQRGVIDEGVQFLQKPFTVRTLASKVREVLDRT
jgi:PAS domain S-box-containing protein